MPSQRPGGPGVVGRPSQRAGSGREAVPESWEWLGGPPRGLGVVGTHSRRVGRPCLRAGSRREALLEDEETLPEGREALPESREW